MPAPTRPSPPPLQVDTVRVVLAGTVLWAIALVVLLFLGDRVDPVWTWTAVAGVVRLSLKPGDLVRAQQVVASIDAPDPAPDQTASPAEQPTEGNAA